MNYNMFSCLDASRSFGTSAPLRHHTNGHLQTGDQWRPGDRQDSTREISRADVRTFKEAEAFERNGFNFHNTDVPPMKHNLNDRAQQNSSLAWNSYASAFQSWLEKYVEQTGTPSSLKNFFASDNASQVRTSDVVEAEQAAVTHSPPPPLLHRPAKRPLEQNHAVMSAPEQKRAREENHHTRFMESPARPSNKAENIRETMFEKTRLRGKEDSSPGRTSNKAENLRETMFEETRSLGKEDSSPARPSNRAENLMETMFEKARSLGKEDSSPGRQSNKAENLRESMFEKNRSLGKALQQLGPPPPLLKNHSEGQNDGHAVSRSSPVKWNASSEPNVWDRNQSRVVENGVKKNPTPPIQNPELLQSPVRKTLSPRDVPVPAVKQKLDNGDPVPRQIDSNDPTSCGGFAFDHMAMPKIIAVHSISNPDEEKCTTKPEVLPNSRAHSNGTSSSMASFDRKGLEKTEITHAQSRSSTEQTQNNYIQDQIAHAQSRASTAQTQNNYIQDQIAHAQSRSSTAQTQNNTIQDKITHAQSRSSTAQTQNNYIQDTITHAQSRSSTAQTQNNYIQDKIAHAQSRSATTQSQNNNIQDKIAHAQSRSSTAQTQNNYIQDTIAHAQSRSSTAQTQNNYVPADLQRQEMNQAGLAKTNYVQSDFERREMILNQAGFVNGQLQPGGSENISFERYLLLYLLQKFQGNVDLVKQILKQNMLQEWVAYCHGNPDPTKQKICGVDFHELRKLYEMRCRMQRSPTAVDGSNSNKFLASQAVLRNLNTGTSSMLTAQSKANVTASQFGGMPQNPESLKAMYFELYKQRSQQAALDAKQKAICAAMNAMQVPTCPDPPQQAQNTVDADVKKASCRDIPSDVQDKIKLLSQNSTKKAGRQEAAETFELPCNQRELGTPQMSIAQPSTVSQIYSVSGSRMASRLHHGGSKGFNSIESTSRDKLKKRQLPSKEEMNVLVHRNFFKPTKPSTTPNIPTPPLEKKNDANLSFSTPKLFFQSKSQPGDQLSNHVFSVPASREPDIPTLAGKANEWHNTRLTNSIKPTASSLKRLAGVEPSEKEVVNSQEAKGNYQWRYKGGKLISCNIPSSNNSKNVTEIELSTLISGQQSRANEKSFTETGSGVETAGQRRYSNGIGSVPLPAIKPRSPSKPCSPGVSCQSEFSIEEQEEHKKVCGAAAAGQRCYCKRVPKSTDKTSNPIRSIQQMVRRAAGQGSTDMPAPVHTERSKMKEQTCATSSSSRANTQSAGQPLKASFPVSQASAKRTLRVETKAEERKRLEKQRNSKTFDAEGNENANVKQFRSPSSPTKKKPYSTVQELGNKIVETRERLERETIPWKKKILKSLEAVLMKRLRKLERETGEEAGIDISEESEITGGKNVPKEAKKGEKNEKRRKEEIKEMDDKN